MLITPIVEVARVFRAAANGIPEGLFPSHTKTLQGMGLGPVNYTFALRDSMYQTRQEYAKTVYFALDGIARMYETLLESPAKDV